MRPSLETMARTGRWPTPTANDWKNAGYQQKDGRIFLTLPGAVGAAKVPERWPTPTARDGKGPGFDGQLPNAVRMWPTPKASPSGPDYAKATRPGSGSDDLATSVARDQGGGQLNPNWVEWLMGFPPGWTDCAA